MGEYRHGAHSVFEIHLHLAWVTKYRKPVLVGPIGVRVRDLIRVAAYIANQGKPGPDEFRVEHEDL
jgi:REP element-mobilizing transposase RayT